MHVFECFLDIFDICHIEVGYLEMSTSGSQKQPNNRLETVTDIILIL